MILRKCLSDGLFLRRGEASVVFHKGNFLGKVNESAEGSALLSSELEFHCAVTSAFPALLIAQKNMHPPHSLSNVEDIIFSKFLNGIKAV